MVLNLNTEDQDLIRVYDHMATSRGYDNGVPEQSVMDSLISYANSRPNLG